MAPHPNRERPEPPIPIATQNFLRFVLTTAKLYLLIGEILQNLVSYFEYNDESDVNALQKAIYHFETKKTAKVIPFTILLFGTGLVGVGGYVRRRFKK